MNIRGEKNCRQYSKYNLRGNVATNRFASPKRHRVSFLCQSVLVGWLIHQELKKNRVAGDDSVPTKLIGQRCLADWVIWRREVFVAIRCQAVESVNECVHRLATVATQQELCAPGLGARADRYRRLPARRNTEPGFRDCRQHRSW